MNLSALFGPFYDDEGYIVARTDADGFIRDEDLLTWQSQVVQYPATGPRGIGYYGGVVTKDYTVDCLLYRSQADGPVLGILNHYPADFKPWERAHNVNIYVDPDYHRAGIGTALLTEAMRRWPDIDLSKQRFSRAGKALAESFGPVGHGHAIAALRQAAHVERTSTSPVVGRYLKFEAVAALLEVHDDTGINLSTFGPVGEFVDHVLDEFGYAPHTSNGA